MFASMLTGVHAFARGQDECSEGEGFGMCSDDLASGGLGSGGLGSNSFGGMGFGSNGLRGRFYAMAEQPGRGADQASPGREDTGFDQDSVFGDPFEMPAPDEDPTTEYATPAAGDIIGGLAPQSFPSDIPTVTPLLQDCGPHVNDFALKVLAWDFLARRDFQGGRAVYVCHQRKEEPKEESKYWSTLFNVMVLSLLVGWIGMRTK